LEVFSRSKFIPSIEWIDLFEALGGQAAIALENSRLVEGLQKVNHELFQAYDETIEGWSHALDLRDKETEGHTQRVTELTVRLASAFGFHGVDLTHIRRGSLLHDIGKMGVPDYILLKPGPLTDEEWVIMRKHPVYAYDLITPIAYLQPAIDIPYCHHEKWDGSGYPRGLKGQEIPFSARIFTVVDVWDALTSDRPYRSAWSREKTLAYISERSGTEFDPQVVEEFVRMICQRDRPA
jgi:putative nucleotidyltransferase with HDIG domain